MLFGYMAVVQMAAFCRHRTCRLCSLTGEDTSQAVFLFHHHTFLNTGNIINKSSNFWDSLPFIWGNRCLVLRPHYSARPMRFGSRDPSEFLFVSDTSPKCLDREVLGGRRKGARQGKPEIPVGKSNGSRHFVWKASENMCCDLRRCKSVFLFECLSSWFGDTLKRVVLLQRQI